MTAILLMPSPKHWPWWLRLLFEDAQDRLWRDITHEAAMRFTHPVNWRAARLDSPEEVALYEQQKLTGQAAYQNSFDTDFAFTFMYFWCAKVCYGFDASSALKASPPPQPDQNADTQLDDIGDDGHRGQES